MGQVNLATSLTTSDLHACEGFLTDAGLEYTRVARARRALREPSRTANASASLCNGIDSGLQWG